ncbi:hypothetical protein ACC771_18835, partial [Rhizobium ruizarguesonis]
LNYRLDHISSLFGKTLTVIDSYHALISPSLHVQDAAKFLKVGGFVTAGIGTVASIAIEGRRSGWYGVGKGVVTSGVSFATGFYVDAAV